MTEYKLPNNAGRSRLIKKIIIEVLKLIEFIILKYPAKNIDDASLMPTSPNEIGGIIVLPNKTKAEYQVDSPNVLFAPNAFNINVY